MEKEMNELITTVLQPALKYLLSNIEKGNYWKIYTFSLLSILILIIMIYLFSLYLAKNKIKAETSKLNAEYKEKQIANLEKLKSYRKKYLDNTILLQMATKDITEAFSLNDIVKLKSNVEEYRDIIFNDLIESFEEYIEIYEIMYLNEKIRFSDLFVDDYMPLMNTIHEMMHILNNDSILTKISLKKYLIERFVFRSLSSYFNRNLSKLRLIKRIKSYCIIRTILKQNGV